MASNAFGTGGAPLKSPAFTGTPTAPTAAPLTDSTQLATTAYADAAVAAAALNTWQPADNGLLLTPCDPAACTNNGIISATKVYLIRIPVRIGCTVSNIWGRVTTIGSGTSTGSYVGLYNSAGSLLSASVDQVTNFTTQGVFEAALVTPQVLAAGSVVYAAIMSNLSSTQPTLACFANASPLTANIGLAATGAALRASLAAATSTTTLPAVVPSTNAITNALPVFLGLS